MLCKQATKKPTITKRKVYNKCTWNTLREDQHFGGNFITTVYTRKKLCRISTIQKKYVPQDLRLGVKWGAKNWYDSYNTFFKLHSCILLSQLQFSLFSLHTKVTIQVLVYSNPCYGNPFLGTISWKRVPQNLRRGAIGPSLANFSNKPWSRQKL